MTLLNVLHVPISSEKQLKEFSQTLATLNLEVSAFKCYNRTIPVLTEMFKGEPSCQQK